MKSILRQYQIKELKKLRKLNGCVIDLGNKNPKAEYLSYLLAPESIVTFTDIDSRGYDSIKIVDFNQPIHKEDYEIYDGVICLNVIEHIENYPVLIANTFNYLKKGGRCYFQVPFLWKVHGDPDDYQRLTKSGLNKLFEKQGFKQINISETGYGPFTVMSGVIDGYLHMQFLKNISIRISSILDTFLETILKKEIRQYALGYTVSAIK